MGNSLSYSQYNMSLFQATFRLRHECPYKELSEQFPDLTIREWYLSDCQVLEITSPYGAQEELIEEIEQFNEVLHHSVYESGLHMVTRACLCSLEESIINRFEEHNCLYQPPAIHKQGWEHYTVIAFDEDDIRSLHEEFENDREIEVLSKTGLSETRIPHSMLAPVDQLFADLTDRQLSALRLALDNGYYEEPRGCSVSELAEQTTVARSTFEEHLRKGENKLIRNAGQFVRLISESQSDDKLQKDQELSVKDKA